ncbi:UNKNOWN [Stylonychia lemnae]|uniref:Uncharacterized protein n=1 Tax=Stylonychia lemnae TaxID=5949 RepID=A0A078AQ95_STYLE|nr:UNKNOWN [Stylonychia lemnae]|eukprot:CDW83412.1 UNKNOWN [Stylonychia lemnae]
MGAPNVWPIAYIIKGIQTSLAIGTTQHPLINDYIQNDSRGKASAFQAFGSTTGDMIFQRNLICILRENRNLCKQVKRYYAYKLYDFVDIQFHWNTLCQRFLASLRNCLKLQYLFHSDQFNLYNSNGYDS